MTLEASPSIYFFVGSINPVKLNSVKRATVTHWPNGQVAGFEVASDVSAQPRTDAETKQGATNRAKAALQAGLVELNTKNSHFQVQPIALGVGLEGGVFEQDGEMWSTVWCVVVDQEGKTFASNGARFLVPKIVADRIRAGEEMGVAASHISGIENVKHKSGLIGIITNDFIDRTAEYSAIARLAIGIWFGRDWEEQLSTK